MKDTLVLRLIVVVNILLVCTLTLIVIYFTKKEEDQVIASDEVMGVQEEKEVEDDTFSISICHNTSCIWISSDGLVNDGIVDENAVYQVVLDSVLPFFEDMYEGKTFVKNRNGGFLYWKRDLIPDLSNIYKDVYESFKKGQTNSIQIYAKDLPGTDGKYAQRYIEIDNSKQKLYVWINGKVEREILLSAAKDGYEVYGVFPIVDKGVSPIAPSGRYMPYWMAFYYSKSQDSWYGLHSLIWWYDENGREVYEPTTNIGIRRSRGCIRMLLEDAKYLYEIFNKGDHILIHE